MESLLGSCIATCDKRFRQHINDRVRRHRGELASFSKDVRIFSTGETLEKVENVIVVDVACENWPICSCCKVEEVEAATYCKDTIPTPTKKWTGPYETLVQVILPALGSRPIWLRTIYYHLELIDEAIPQSPYARR